MDFHDGAEVLAEVEAAMTHEPKSLVGLSLERTIRLRWALRDIKAKRTKITPVSPDDLQTLIELSLVEMRDQLPFLTAAGHRALTENPNTVPHLAAPGSGLVGIGRCETKQILVCCCLRRMAPYLQAAAGRLLRLVSVHARV